MYRIREIAKAIADRLWVTLVGGRDDRLVERATTNIEAYQLYLKGRALVDRRGANSGWDRAAPAAVELDPGYSLVWAGIANALTVLAYSGAAQALRQRRRRWRQHDGRSSSIPNRQRPIPRSRARLCCLKTTARWRSKSSSERWSSIRVTRWVAAGTGDFFLNWVLRGLQAGHRRSSPRARRRSAVRVCHHDPRCLSAHGRAIG